MQIQQEWPKLPSIQSMLEGVKLNEAVMIKSKGHRRHASEHTSAFKPFVDRKTMIDNSMSGQLERLSIQPIPIEPKIVEGNNNQALLPFRPHLSSRSPRISHTRSYSDYTHPYPQSTPVKPNTFSHRRALSLNTLTSSPPPLVYGSCSSSSSTVTISNPHTSEEDNDEEDSCSEDSSYSEKDINSKSRKKRLPPSKKYYCPYCTKAFSRPSSLRIHTYSHTGERPFACPEKDCNRKFSVQSNMRRHLRVHRTGRPTRRNGSSLTPAEKAQLINKPLAAKPSNK